MTNRTLKLAATALAGLLITSCGQSTLPQAQVTPASQNLSAQALGAPGRQLLTVPAPAGTTAQTLRKRYPGTSVRLIAAGAQGFALLERGASPSVPAHARAEKAGKTVRSPELASAQSDGHVWMESDGHVWMESNGHVWMDSNGHVWMESNGHVWMESNGHVWMESGGVAVSANPTLEPLRPAADDQRGQGRSVALIDGGVDLAHPLLQGRAVGMSDLVEDDADPREGAPTGAGYGHGTAVAGLVAQLAPHAQIRVYRALDDQGQGEAADVAEAIVQAAQAGADVINLSLSTDEPSPAIDAAVQYARAQGSVVSAATGNQGLTAPMGYPAATAGTLAGLLSVGSVNDDAPLGTRAAASWSAGGLSAERLTPGTQLLTAYPNLGAARWTGTSMSTAVASGLLAATPAWVGAD